MEEAKKSPIKVALSHLGFQSLLSGLLVL